MFDEETLAKLSPQERAALQEDDDDDNDGVVGDNETDGDDNPAATQQDDATALTQALDDTAADDDTREAVTTDETSGDDTTAGDDMPEFRATYQVEVPADFKERMSAIDEKIADLEREYREDGIDFIEFRERERELLAEQKELNDLQIKAQIAEESSQQAELQRWQWEVERFKREAKRRDGIDYDEDKRLTADLDLMVKGLASDPENGERDAEWFLNEAHKRVKALRGLSVEAPRQDKTDPLKTHAASRVPPKPVKTLADVPTASRDDASIGEGEFSHLARLSGPALEKAVAKLTPDQQDRWARES